VPGQRRVASGGQAAGSSTSTGTSASCTLAPTLTILGMEFSCLMCALMSMYALAGAAAAAADVNLGVVVKQDQGMQRSCCRLGPGTSQRWAWAAGAGTGQALIGQAAGSRQLAAGQSR
jgi:hypothetical protein